MQTRRSPIVRMKIDSIESVIRKTGNENNINAYPHKFRRTFATRCIKNHMPMSSLSKIMGHENIDTTMTYCDIDKYSLHLDYMQYAK